MKCPFRTIRRVRQITYDYLKINGDYDESIDFADCLENECPYYGQPVLKHSDSGGFRRVIEPECRRCNDGK